LTQSVSSFRYFILVMATIYIVTFVLIFLTAYELITIRHNPTARQRYAWSAIWISFSLMIFVLAATRVGGSDWENYETLFNQVASADSLSMAIITNGLLEPGYVFLNFIVSELGGDRRDLIIIESGIAALSTYLLLTKVRGGSIIVTWLMTLTFIGLMPVRQTVALSLVMIVFVIKSSSLRIASSMIAPSFHISAIVLLLAKYLGGKHLTNQIKIAMILFISVGMYFFSALLIDKIDLYRNTYNELTDLSTSAVLIGKVLTLTFITTIWYYASTKPQVSACPNLLSYKTLHIITLLSFLMLFINPAFARLISVFEIIYIWAAAQNIYYLKNKRERLALYSIIAIIVVLKVTKSLVQFKEIYDVCFLCVGAI
jgi:hypothetical protein